MLRATLIDRLCMTNESHEPVQYMARTREYYAAQGFDPYTWAHHDSTPFAPLRKPLAQSTLALITTAAAYDRHASDPRRVMSEPVAAAPEKLYANDLSWDREATHMEDRASFFPLEVVTDLVGEGRLGALAERFHCAPTEYSQRRTVEADAPLILERLIEDGVDLALLIPI